MPSVKDEGLTRTDVTVCLECRHEIRFKAAEPKPGENIWCSRCGHYRQVTHVHGKMGVNCRDCRYARHVGGRVTPRTLATSHAIRHLGHRVDIHTSDGVETIAYEPQYLTEVPPF